VHDLRYALRLLIRNPVVTGAVVLSIGLGTGANIAIFSVLNALLLRAPTGVVEPERLVALYEADRKGWERDEFSYPEYEAIGQTADVFSEVMAVANVEAYLSGAAGAAVAPQPIQAAVVSGNYFDGLGVRPELGRGFRADEDAVPDRYAVAVLGHRLWRERYGADPGILGRAIVLNGHPFVVVGVAPRGFTGTLVDAAPDLWVPTMMQARITRPPRVVQAATGTSDLLGQRGYGWLSVVGRLQPGIRIEAAAAGLRARRASLAEDTSARDDRTMGLLPLIEARLSPPLRALLPQLLRLLLVSSSLLLLLATANIANLLLHRVLTRRREMAVRLALGVGRMRLVRQLLTESLVLSIVGGALGLLLAGWTRSLILAAAPAVSTTLLLDLRMDGRVLAFAALLSLATGALCGLSPAIRASGVDVLGALKGEGAEGGSRGAGSRRPSRLLVAVQVSLCLLLLVWTGLLLQSLRNLLRLDPGFRTDVLLVSLDLEFSHPSDEQGQRFYQELYERTSALPGVTSATFVRSTPLRRTVYERGRQDAIQIGYDVVGLGYFETMGIPLRSGRAFEAGDRAGSSPVVIVNEALARLLWPGENALGKRDSQREIIGVAADARASGLGIPPEPMTYLPLLQHYEPRMILAVRGTLGPRALEAAVRSAVAGVDPQVPILGVRTVAEQRERSLWPTRFAARLLALFGVVALGLACLGAYGVASQAMAQRTREFGIRMAIGAARQDLYALVAKQEGAALMAGVLAGIVAAMALGKLPSAFLHGVGATSAGMIAVMSLLVAIPVMVAIVLAARRIVALDPVVVLRHE
jgi:putative ABC transport system permease protein